MNDRRHTQASLDVSGHRPGERPLFALAPVDVDAATTRRNRRGYAPPGIPLCVAKDWYEATWSSARPEPTTRTVGRLIHRVRGALWAAQVAAAAWLIHRDRRGFALGRPDATAG